MNTTAFFDSWFDKSKVRDKSKQSLTVYHGTTSDFKVFRTNPLEAKTFYGFGQTVIGAFSRKVRALLVPIRAAIQSLTVK